MQVASSGVKVFPIGINVLENADLLITICVQHIFCMIISCCGGRLYFLYGTEQINSQLTGLLNPIGNMLK